MTKREYHLRSSALRRVIRSSNAAVSTEPFTRVDLNGTVYIYNTLSRNIIYKYRVTGNGVGIQYRATSIYRPVLERIIPIHFGEIRRLASPNMRRHVRDVRARIT